MTMSARVKRQVHVLHTLSKGHPDVCKAILRHADSDLLRCLSECAHNILKGTVQLKPAEKESLKKYRLKVRKIADKKTPLKQKLKIVQTGGFIPALLGPLLKPLIVPLASQLVGGVISSIVPKNR